jgi:hypothetical protein
MSFVIAITPVFEEEIIQGACSIPMEHSGKMQASKKDIRNFGFLIGVDGIDISEGSPYEAALLAAGCDDAIICISNGELTLDFDRESVSFEEAIASATDDIKRADGVVTYVERCLDHLPGAQ